MFENSERVAPGTCVHHLFESQAAVTPDRIAASCGGRSITYSQLNQRANRLAHLLRARGVGRDVLVGLLVDRSIETLVGLLAVLKAGGAYVPLDPEYPSDRIAYILENAHAPLAVADPRSAASHHLSPDATVLLDPSDEVSAGQPADDPLHVNDGHDLAYVIYTSGSTGRPKGVQITHKGVVNFLRSMRCRPGIGASDVMAAVTTVSFDIAVLELLLPLTVGARTVIVSRDVATDGRRLAELIHGEAATLMQATPATWRLLLDAGWEGGDLSVLCGGEAMPRELADRLLPRCRALWNMYGPTETTVWSTVHRVTPGKGPVPLGEPIANTSLHVLDDALRPVADGEEGELCIGGDGVARGYLGRPDLTAERFVSDPFSSAAGARLYRTGDLARRLPDGTLVFGGRRDHQVKIRGFRIELGEIENVLLLDPDVREAAVIAREDDRGEKRLAAFVAWREGRGGDTRAVRERLRGVLPNYMVPSWIAALDELPRTPNGKTDRNALAALSPVTATTVVGPHDDIERRLVRLWEEVLDSTPISVDSDFFEIGGDSLHAAALFARIAREFGKDVPVATLVQAPTVEKLAAVLRGHDAATEWATLVPFRTTGSKRPFFFVHGGAGTVLFMRELVAGIDPERPVYGLQSEGQDGRPVAHDSVEQMAALYRAEMRRVQPSGPYLLGGYCFGGVVAFEIARQLREQGEEVSFVGLVNAPCPLVQPSAIGANDESVSLAPPWAAPRAGDVLTARVRGVPWTQRPFAIARAVRDGMAWRWDVARALARRVPLAPLGARVFFALGRRVPKAWRSSYILWVTEQAERRYRPRPYAGRISIIRGNGLYTDPELGWRGLATTIDTSAIGGHQRLRRELIGAPFVGELAAELRARLDRAEADAGAA